jgi:hypothetical protein
MRWWFGVLACVVMLLVGCSSGDSGPGATPPSTATSGASATPERTSTIAATPTDDVAPLRMAEPIEVGAGPGQLDVTLYIEQGCTGCDGPPTAIERVYRDASGVLRREQLFTKPDGAHYMTTTAVAPDGRLFATACFGDCAEVGSFLREGSSAFFVSIDGGEAWTRSDYPAESLRIATLLPSGQPVVRVAPAGATETDARFEMWPLSDSIQIPGPKFWPFGTLDRFHPLVWENWETGERLFQDGSAVEIPVQGGNGADGMPRFAGVQPPGGWVVNWFERQRDSEPLTQRILASTYAGAVRWEYRVPGEIGAIIPTGWLDETHAIVWMNYNAPAIVDFDAGSIREIIIGDPLDQFGGRNKPIGIAPKP